MYYTSIEVNWKICTYDAAVKIPINLLEQVYDRTVFANAPGANVSYVTIS